MDRRKFLIGAGGTALALGFAPPLFSIAATPDTAALYRDSTVIDALASPVARDDTPPTASDIRQAKQSGVTAVNYTISARDFEGTVKNIAFAQSLADQHSDTYLLVRHHSDIARAKREGKMGI